MTARTEGNIDCGHLCGFFTIRSDTKLKRALLVFLGIPAGVGFFALGIALVYELLTGSGSGFGATGAPSEGFLLVGLLLLALLGGPALVLVGFSQVFARPGLYLKGMRTTATGFENGTLVVPLEAVEPRVGFGFVTPRSGRLLRGSWESQPCHPRGGANGSAGELSSRALSMVVILKQVSGSFFYVRSCALASGDKLLGQVDSAKTFAETNGSDLAVVLDGQLRLLGDTHFILPAELVQTLERIADVLARVGPSQSHFPCTLVLVAKTVSFVQSLPFGLLGAAVAAGVDSRSRSTLRERFAANTLFDDGLTKALVQFADDRGWAITVGDHTVHATPGSTSESAG